MIDIARSIRSLAARIAAVCFALLVLAYLVVDAQRRANPAPATVLPVIIAEGQPVIMDTPPSAIEPIEQDLAAPAPVFPTIEMIPNRTLPGHAQVLLSSSKSLMLGPETYQTFGTPGTENDQPMYMSSSKSHRLSSVLRPALVPGTLTTAGTPVTPAPKQP